MSLMFLEVEVLLCIFGVRVQRYQLVTLSLEFRLIEKYTWEPNRDLNVSCIAGKTR